MAALLLDDPVALAGTYRLLARLWSKEVDAELLDALRSRSLGDAFTAAGGLLPERNDEQTREELAIDYCQLFLGPRGHLVPVQSVWQSGQFRGGDCVPSMARFMDAVGYTPTGAQARLMSDHLGVQLDLMGHLLDQFTVSPDIHDELSEIAAAFFVAHLRWPRDLLSASMVRATTGFYRSTIGLTQAFLQSEGR